MTITAADIDRMLNDAHDRLDVLASDQRVAGERAAAAKVDYEVAFAKALLDARDRGLSVESSKAEATLKSADECRTHLIAESTARSARSAVQVLTTQVDILRSMAASHRGVF